MTPSNILSDSLLCYNGIFAPNSSPCLQVVPDSLDTTLYPIMNRRQCEQTGVVTLVDIDIEYNKDFRLYLTTSLSNPDFPPEDCIKMTMINFTVIFSGLQEQLLSRVVKIVCYSHPGLVFYTADMQ